MDWGGKLVWELKRGEEIDFGPSFSVLVFWFLVFGFFGFFFVVVFCFLVVLLFCCFVVLVLWVFGFF